MKKLFAIILALLLLTGCSWDHPTTDGQPFQNETASASGGSATASDGSGPVPSQTKTIHVEKTLEENLRVDLDLTIPGSDDDPGTYLAEMPPIDQDSINRFLEAQGDSVTEVTGESTFDGVYGYNANTKLGEIHWSRRSRENIRPYNTMSYCRKTEASVYPHYLQTLQYHDDDDSSFLSRFPEKDLPFMTLAQAEQKAIDALALLGIHDVVFARELCLDHEGMTAYVQSLGSRINDKEGGTSEDFSGVTFGEEVDAYTFTMIFEKDGVRTTRVHFVNTTLQYDGTEIRMTITADGIVDFIMNFPYNFGARLATEATRADPEAILAVVEAGAMDTLSPHERVIESMQLEYLHWQDGDRWILKPVWVVRTRTIDALTFYNGEKGDTVFFQMFDFATGEEITSGGEDM